MFINKYHFYYIFLVLFVSITHAQTKKSLVIMLDGVRADAIAPAHTPHLDKLVSGNWQKDYNCAYSLRAQSIFDAPSNSAPNHVSIATGVNAKKHLVANNGQTAAGAYQKHPIYLDLLIQKHPQLSTAFFFCWGEDADLKRQSDKLRFQHGKDEEIKNHVVDFIKKDGDAALIYFDLPDGMGHTDGFYPHGKQYLQAIETMDIYLGEILASISQRPHFQKEDWQIIILADHGGYKTSHGMEGGCAHTVPLFIASKAAKQGRMAGTPSLLDVAPTVLDHMGLDVSSYDFDGAPRGQQVLPPSQAKLGDDLEFYFSFDENQIQQDVDTKKIKLHGDLVQKLGEGKFNSALLLSPQSFAEILQSQQTLDKGKGLSVSMWVKVPAQQGDPLILSNKNWSNGANDGFALHISQSMRLNLKDAQGRVDMRHFDREEGVWMFIAFTAANEDAAEIYQGVSTGTLYFFSSPTSLLSLWSPEKYNIHIGQDGTGAYPHGFQGAIDDLAIWSRALSTEEIESIYRAGLKKISLQELKK